jgi:hypothetical protein
MKGKYNMANEPTKFERCEKVWVWDGLEKCRGIIMKVCNSGNYVISYSKGPITEVSQRVFTPKEAETLVSKREKSDYLLFPNGIPTGKE